MRFYRSPEPEYLNSKNKISLCVCVCFRAGQMNIPITKKKSLKVKIMKHIQYI